MIKKIITYPNPMLNTVSEDVTQFDDTLIALLADMHDTLKSVEGLGLAAIQIGVPEKVVIIYYPDGGMIEAINPKITYHSNEEQHLYENCLSIPRVGSPVTRSLEVTVSYKDRFGEIYSIVAKGREATIWQHELEHLKGKLYIDNLSKSKLKRLKATYKKGAKNG